MIPGSIRHIYTRNILGSIHKKGHYFSWIVAFALNEHLENVFRGHEDIISSQETFRKFVKFYLEAGR